MKVMEDSIQQNINNPAELERLYRNSPAQFETAFLHLYPSVAHYPVAETWRQRLTYQKSSSFNWGSRHEIRWVLLLAFVSGCIAQLPFWFNWSTEEFFTRNIPFVVFPALLVYFAIKKEVSIRQLVLPALLIVFAAVYVNCIPYNSISQTSQLSSVHLPFFLWTVAGFIFAGASVKKPSGTIQYLQHNGNWLVISAIMVLSAFLFTAISVALFEVIGINLVSFYQKYVLVWVLAAFPMIATYLVLNNPQLVNRISPLIAGIFTPIVLCTLFVFLLALAFSSKNIYTDRNFLMIFNLVLIGVMAIIFFSLTSSRQHHRSILHYLQTILSVLALIANVIALSAIIFRLSSFGFTPNRVAVLGANLLIFIHVALISFQLIKSLQPNGDIEKVEEAIVRFLPVYSVWTGIVVFVFPLLFHYA
jgi:hypothetical protein